MNSIQGELAPLYISSDGGITWKTLVCLETYDVGLDTTVNQEETNCGVAVGLGAIKFAPTGSAVCEASPTTSQVTFKDMVGWQVAKTLVMFKSEYPYSGGQYGANLALSGTCYVTSTKVTLQTGKVITFTFTLTGTGTVNTTPIN
jgi:hypothetical protein